MSATGGDNQEEQGDDEGNGEGEALEDEWDYVQGLLWQDHPVRELLLNALINKEIPTDYRLMAPLDVWNKYCDNDIFEGMEYDAFKRRLLALRNQVKVGWQRAEQDLQSFKIAKQNHPPPPRNHRDEPHWSGSEAQRLLKEDMDNNMHFNLKPEHLWESRPEYGEFYLSTFRDHLWQEHKTRKYLYTLKLRSEEKKQEKINEAKKKHDAEVARKVAAEEKKIKAAEKLADKERKAAERLAEKERKAAEKIADKERKAVERLAEKERKAAAKVAERLAEKERKATAKAAERLAEKERKATAKQAEKDAKAEAKQAERLAKQKELKKKGNKTKAGPKKIN